MCNLTSKSNIFSYISFIALTLLFPFLSGGCQEEESSTISVAPDTPPPPAPIEAPTSLPGQSIIHVPQGKPLDIDGTISPGEWDSAEVETFSDGSELFLMYKEGYLYLGIRANTPEMIVGNIFIDRGDEIAILHASAALGTAIYEKVMGSWQRTRDFVWRCRKTDDSETTQAERDAFLEEEYWVAANARMGTPNELEYQIEMTNENLRLAVTFIRASNPNMKIPWPNDLDDDCIKSTVGGMPTQLFFTPEKWATIGISSSES
jgi:hypothetical protein